MTPFYIFAAIFFIASVAIHILLSEHLKITLYSDFIAVAVAALPVVTGLYVFRYFKKGSPERTVWAVFIAGLILWFVGEARNLNSHLNHLERGGYVSVRKGLISKGPRTIVEITSRGEEELKTYLSRLKVGLSYEEP